LALTFGTLLSSQGADAHVPGPIARTFFVAVIPTVHRVPQQSNLRDSAGGFPGLAARSVLARCRENITRPQRAVHAGVDLGSADDPRSLLSREDAPQATP
jgi:hypothetical protein